MYRTIYLKYVPRSSIELILQLRYFYKINILLNYLTLLISKKKELNNLSARINNS